MKAWATRKHGHGPGHSGLISTWGQQQAAAASTVRQHRRRHEPDGRTGSPGTSRPSMRRLSRTTGRRVSVGLWGDGRISEERGDGRRQRRPAVVGTVRRRRGTVWRVTGGGWIGMRGFTFVYVEDVTQSTASRPVDIARPRVVGSWSSGIVGRRALGVVEWGPWNGGAVGVSWLGAAAA